VTHRPADAADADAVVQVRDGRLTVSSVTDPTATVAPTSAGRA
jgi:ABC-type transport system involved in cytochrome bd biosynthesis fused ATPase/permease subunit